MKNAFLETQDDIKWLNETHLKGVPLPSNWKEFKSAVIQGNEDAPHALNLYLSDKPNHTDNYLRVKFPGDGLVYAEYEEYTGGTDEPKTGSSKKVSEDEVAVLTPKRAPKP